MNLIGFWKTSYGQERPTKTIDAAKYIEMIEAIAERNRLADDLKLSDSMQTKYKKEIDRKENVILRTIEQRNTCYDEVKVLKDEITIKDVLLANRQNTINKLEQKAKPKRWGVGPYVGYGMGTRLSVNTGFSIQYSIIRF